MVKNVSFHAIFLSHRLNSSAWIAAFWGNKGNYARVLRTTWVFYAHFKAIFKGGCVYFWQLTRMEEAQWGDWGGLLAHTHTHTHVKCSQPHCSAWSWLTENDVLQKEHSPNVLYVIKQKLLDITDSVWILKNNGKMFGSRVCFHHICV